MCCLVAAKNDSLNAKFAKQRKARMSMLLIHVPLALFAVKIVRIRNYLNLQFLLQFLIFVARYYYVCRDGGIGRRTGLKILWELVPVPVRLRLSVLRGGS